METGSYGSNPGWYIAPWLIYQISYTTVYIIYRINIPVEGDLEKARNEMKLGAEHSEAIDLFCKGLALYRAGEVGKAVAEWRSAIELEPGNYIIRKQVWAIQNPDRFYSGDVDYSWQKEQMEQGL